MYCAGDDDQAIYDFAGADVDHFINLPGGAEILEKSYRVPASVHKLAMGLSSRIQRRFPKNYVPKTDVGSVQRIYSPESLDFSKGDWLILSQANYQINPVSSILKQSGYYFERSGYPSVSPKVSTALLAWKKLQNNDVIDVGSAQVLYSFMRGNGVRVERGFKTLKAGENVFLSLDQLQKDHGLLATADMDWQTALDRLPDMDRAYINALLRRGEDLEEMPRIKLSTIHGAKGGEAENVVVFSDLTAAADESLQISPDTLHRVFYVAVTRTKKNLYIVEPEIYQRSYNL